MVMWSMWPISLVYTLNRCSNGDILDLSSVPAWNQSRLAPPHRRRRSPCSSPPFPTLLAAVAALSPAAVAALSAARRGARPGRLVLARCPLILVRPSPPPSSAGCHRGRLSSACRGSILVPPSGRHRGLSSLPSRRRGLPRPRLCWLPLRLLSRLVIFRCSYILLFAYFAVIWILDEMWGFFKEGYQ